MELKADIICTLSLTAQLRGDPKFEILRNNLEWLQIDIFSLYLVHLDFENPDNYQGILLDEKQAHDFQLSPDDFSLESIGESSLQKDPILSSAQLIIKDPQTREALERSISALL